MTESNPYASPSANLERNVASAFRLTGPRAVATGRGWGWIAEGFTYFKRNPGPWILTVIVALVIFILLALIPLLGQIVSAVTYFVWTAGFMLGCRAQDQGQPFEISHLFAGFKNPGKLIVLSLIVSAAGFAVMLVAMGPLYLDMISGGSEPSPELIEAMDDPASFFLPLLFGMLLMVPLIMAMYFAPALIALNDCGVGEAMKLSFKGCLKNILPMLLYGVIGLVLYVLSVIPLGLGLLVFVPTFIASVYVSYKDVFIDSTPA